MTKKSSKYWPAELAKDIKSEKDLGTLTQQLIKLIIETALNAEMDEHLGYQKHAQQGRETGNNRKGQSHLTNGRPAPCPLRQGFEHP